MKHYVLAATTFAAVSTMSAAANADIIVLDFEGVGNEVAVLDFYNGGTDGAGNSGTNYGISFGPNSLGIIDSDAGGTGNIGNEPSPDTVLFFLTGTAIMNVAAGFDVGFSFFYSSVTFNGTVRVYDGLDGTGNLLASLDLVALGAGPGDPNGAFSNWAAVGVAFDGIARSVDFGGVVNQIAFDDITLGTDVPGTPVPEPAALALLGLGLAGLGIARRRRG